MSGKLIVFEGTDGSGKAMFMMSEKGSSLSIGT